MKKILVPVDFSDCSREAYAYAKMIAEPFDAQIEVLHVWQLPILAASGDVLISIPDQPYVNAAKWVEDGAATELDKLVGRDPRVTKRLESGRAEETIVAAATEGSFDLIVMGTHGRSGLTHLLIGSVAERVVRLAPCPVLTVKQR